MGKKKAMKPVKIKSSNINQVGYDIGLKILHVWFKSGARYEYYNVPKDIADRCQDIENGRTVFKEEVKNKFQYAKHEA